MIHGAAVRVRVPGCPCLLFRIGLLVTVGSLYRRGQGKSEPTVPPHGPHCAARHVGSLAARERVKA